MKLSWDNITVQQFQDIHRLSLNTDLDEMDKVERVICILYDLTEEKVENMSVKEFAEKSRDVAFVMNTQIPGKPKRTIRGAKGKYRIEYTPSRLKHRQYIEVLTFGEKPIENLHLLLASIVQPVNWLGLKRKNNVLEHEAIANDLLQAPVKDVYNTCLFFCKLYINSTKAIKGYLVTEMSQKMETKEAEALLQVSLNAMDGFIQQSK